MISRINIRWNFGAWKADDSPWTVVSAQGHVSEWGQSWRQDLLPQRGWYRGHGVFIWTPSVHITDQEEVSIWQIQTLVKLDTFNEFIVTTQPYKQLQEGSKPQIILTDIPSLVEVKLWKITSQVTKQKSFLIQGRWVSVYMQDYFCLFKWVSSVRYSRIS